MESVLATINPPIRRLATDVTARLRDGRECLAGAEIAWEALQAMTLPGRVQARRTTPFLLLAGSALEHCLTALLAAQRLELNVEVRSAGPQDPLALSRRTGVFIELTSGQQKLLCRLTAYAAWAASCPARWDATRGEPDLSVFSTDFADLVAIAEHAAIRAGLVVARMAVQAEEKRWP